MILFDSQLISLGDFADPLTFKPFTDSTAIVVVVPTGNVYSRDSVERLNYKPQHMFDLLNDVPFKREDVITIQVIHSYYASSL